MATNAFTAQEGMRVLGADGKEIGRVAYMVREIRAASTADELAENTRGMGLGESPGLGGAGSFSPPSNTATWTSSERGFIVVAHGGLLGLGASHFYVPFDSVTHVVPGDSLTLSCGAEECSRNFGKKPEGLA